MKEGIYLNLPMEDYRKAEGVSQSELKEFGRAATPLHFRHRKKKEPTPDMEFGTVCHAAILQPELLESAYHLKPETYPDEKGNQKPWMGQANWCKQWLKDHSDRPVMTKADMVRVAAIATNARKLEMFSAALENGQTEVSFFKRDDETGLMLKARCDLLAETADGSTWIFDPKKVQSGEANQEDFGRQAYNLGYLIQAASYLEITGASKFVFVPFDDEAPYAACLWEPDSDAIAFGYREWRRLLREYNQCVRSDAWPGYPIGIGKLKLPSFVVTPASKLKI